MTLNDCQIWFLTGSQHLYGPEAIEQVAEHSREIAAFLNAAAIDIDAERGIHGSTPPSYT